MWLDVGVKTQCHCLQDHSCHRIPPVRTKIAVLFNLVSIYIYIYICLNKIRHYCGKHLEIAYNLTVQKHF